MSKILFIIFPGLGSTIKHFKLNDINGRFYNNSNFLNTLKKMGDIYFVKHNWNNLNYYDKNETDEKYLYENNIDFNLEDMNVNNVCLKVYNDVKYFDGKFVLIGHSIGSIFLYNFSQKYSTKCLYNFIIDGQLFGPFYTDKNMRNMLINKSKNVSNDKLLELILKVKTNDNNSKELQNLQLIIGGYLENQVPINAKKIKVNTISFRNLQINNDPSGHKYSNEHIQANIDMEDYFYKNNPNKYRTIYLINKTHIPYWNKESREIILDSIKCTIKSAF